MKQIECELLVIGSGMAGMATAMFAVDHGFDTAQVGVTGEINFASGLLDVLGVHPYEKGVRWENPWEGIRALCHDEPRHPYARLTVDNIQDAITRCIAFLKTAGLDYTTLQNQNANVITPAGTVKTTYAFPCSMLAGVHALKHQTPTLLVDFHGLKGFSARQIIQTIGTRWPGLSHVRLRFPDSTGELYTEHAARKLDLAPYRTQLADLVRPHIGKAEAIGLPALLGLYRTGAVVADLETLLGKPVFEIPTMVPAITGLRLREAFEQQLPAAGVKPFYQQSVREAVVQKDGHLLFTVGDAPHQFKILARSAILATGRFFGKGLHADRSRIHEALFDLPVYQPAERTAWHRRNLFNAQGHPINRAGLMIDDGFRPMDHNGRVIHPNLYAAGSILAHQDWIRQKCGSGLSIATAYGAVNALAAATKP